MRVYLRSILMVFIASLFSKVADGEPDAQQKAVATDLFNAGQKLMAEGRVQEACPKYAESQRLDPQLGTLLYLADCYDEIGKTASAWASFNDAVEIASRRQDPREARARARVADLESRLARLTIEVAPDAPPSIQVKKDGELLGRAVWNSPEPSDPGPHVITASADARKDWQMTIDVPAGAKNVRVQIPNLETAPATPTSPVYTNNPQLNAPVSASPVPEERSGNAAATQRTIGYIVGGVGVVGLAVGTLAFLSMKSKESDRDDANACSATQSCTDSDVARIQQLASSTDSRRTIANIGFVAGGAAVVGGAILVLTALPRQSKNARALNMQPWVCNNTAGLAIGGRW